MDDDRIRLKCPRCRTVQKVDRKLAELRQVYCPCGARMGLPRHQPKAPGEPPPEPDTEYEVLDDPELVLEEEPPADDDVPTGLPLGAGESPLAAPRAVRPEPVFPLPSEQVRVPSYWLVNVASRGLIGSGVVGFAVGIVLIVTGLLGAKEEVASTLGVAAGVPMVLYGVVAAVGGAVLGLARDMARQSHRLEAAIRDLRADLRDRRG